MTDTPSNQSHIRRRRILASLVLVAYLGFSLWTFMWSGDIVRALTWYVPISIVLWLVLRRLRPRT